MATRTIKKTIKPIKRSANAKGRKIDSVGVWVSDASAWREVHKASYEILPTTKTKPRRSRLAKHAILYAKILAVKKGEWLPVKCKDAKTARSLRQTAISWFKRHHPNTAIKVSADRATIYFSR